ncbi:MAG: GMC family oxidoreductase [Polyangiaceae bacterium]
MNYFTDFERKNLQRIAEVATPAGQHVPPITEATVDAIEGVVGLYGQGGLKAYRGFLWALDAASLALFGGKRLGDLPQPEREAALLRLAESEATAWFVRAVTAPMKVAQSQKSSLSTVFDTHDGRTEPLAREHARWEQRIVDGRTLEHDETLDVDVVVVGTGAGGAPMARALAARGHAVVMLETGSHFTRSDFVGRPLELQQKLYWNGGVTGSLGNAAILVPMGRTVGGSTTINSGTCYRTPEQTLKRWQIDLGLHDFAPGALDPYFEKVEAALEVEVARPDTLGGCARVIARGCDALGWSHKPLMRNAPGCDGQGVCVFGCPTDAKRSTNVSYVPQALNAGAMLYTNAHVTKVLVEGGRAVGVVARVGAGEGERPRLTVRARAVVLAAGTLHTPGLLLRQGLANSSGQLGRNLTLHPASYAWAAFDEPIRGFDEIPQGYGVDEFAEQGIQLEGAFVPLSLAAGTMGHVGRRWTDLVERLDELACFGFMIADTSRGRVVLGPSRRPQMTYVMNDHDVRRMVKAFGLLSRIYFAAGARRVYPGLQGRGELTSLADVERLEHEGVERVRPHHIDLSAYHPLGTCRMSADPRRSVIGPTQETWDVPGLFVCDGSSVPGPLGVNPQMTIMALSERNSTFVERRIENGARPRRAASEGAAVEFGETMSGMLALDAAEGGGCVDASFTVRAETANSILDALKDGGGKLHLDGEITIAGLVTKRPCEGTLLMRPSKRRGTLVYDLFFEDDQGNACTLHGEKHAGLLSGLRGMTTLYTEVRRQTALYGQGVLTFALSDLAPWLKSFRVFKRALPNAAE